MRWLLLGCVLTLLSCGSETTWRQLEVETSALIKLPSEALFGNIASFAGLSAAVPDIFVEERLGEEDGAIVRDYRLFDGHTIKDKLIEINDLEYSIRYECISTTLPIKEWINELHVEDVQPQKAAKLIWTSKIDVQNINRARIKQKIKGLQESYIYSLELLGEEMDELLNDENF